MKMKITFSTLNPFDSLMWRIFLHVGFWMFFLVLILGTKQNVTPMLVLTWLTVISVSAIVVYTNLYFLIPFYFLKAKYVLYFLMILATIFLGALIIDLLSVLKYYAIEIRFADSLKNLLIFIIITSSLRFFKESVTKQLLLSKLEQKQIQTELSLLKLQVNPHFLFNTLNNLYAINLENHDKANELILQLANFLRTQLVVSEKPIISLKDEIDIIKNYIDLEKIRQYNCEVLVNIPDDVNDLLFPTLLLLPLVENAFKHGVKFFVFTIQLTDQYFIFETKNGIRNSKPLRNGGLGLSNVNKRLNLIFKDNFSMVKTIDETSFCLVLKIKLHCLTNGYLRYRIHSS